VGIAIAVPIDPHNRVAAGEALGNRSACVQVLHARWRGGDRRMVRAGTRYHHSGKNQGYQDNEKSSHRMHPPPDCIHLTTETGLRQDVISPAAKGDSRARCDTMAAPCSAPICPPKSSGILWVSERSIPRRAIGLLVRSLQKAADNLQGLDDLILPLTADP